MAKNKLRVSEPADALPEAVPEKSKKRGGGFRIGMVIYTWILLMLCGGVLAFFYRYLGDYELSGVKYYAQQYLDSIHQQPPEAAVRALSDLDPEIRSPEENLRWAEGLFSDCELLRQSSQSSEYEKHYSVKASDGQIIGAVTFAVTDRGRFDLPVWSTVDEQFDFSSYYQTLELVVPPDYSVTLGGKLLGPESVTERDIPYAALEECYQHYEDLPRLLRYSCGPFVESPALRVLDHNGKEHPLEELTEELFLEHCDPEMRARIEEFASDFVIQYAFYSADVGGSAMAYYGKVMRLTVPDSPLREQITRAVGSFGWSNTKALKIESIQLNTVTDLGQGRYLARVAYDSQITGLHGTFPSHDDVQIVLFDLDGTLLADALYFT